MSIALFFILANRNPFDPNENHEPTENETRMVKVFSNGKEKNYEG